jgi:hypothetical protein
LAEPKPAAPILKNRVAPEIEAAVVAFAIEQPAWGQLRVSNELLKRGMTVSPFGVRSIWGRHDLTTMRLRFEGPRSEDGAGTLHPHREPARRAR